jgi:hypothetical protein
MSIESRVVQEVYPIFKKGYVQRTVFGGESKDSKKEGEASQRQLNHQQQKQHTLNKTSNQNSNDANLDDKALALVRADSMIFFIHHTLSCFRTLTQTMIIDRRSR